MDSDAAHPPALTFCLAKVQSGSELETELPHGAKHRVGASHRFDRFIESREDTVARGVDHPAPEPPDFAAREQSLIREEPMPPVIAQLDGDVG